MHFVLQISLLLFWNVSRVKFGEKLIIYLTIWTSELTKFDLPGIHHRSKIQTSWSTSGDRRESTWRRFRTTIWKWPAASTVLCLCSAAPLLSSSSPRTRRRRCNFNKTCTLLAGDCKKIMQTWHRDTFSTAALFSESFQCVTKDVNEAPTLI